MLIRNICELYHGMTPDLVSRMSLDQIYTLGMDRKQLERITGSIVTGSPSQLAARGIIPLEKESLLSILKREKAAKDKADARTIRKKRRAEKRKAAIAFKETLKEL